MKDKMLDPGLEQKLIQLPQLQAGKGVWQNKFHEFDVYGHTLSYVHHIKELTADPEMIVAGYLHDIGKPVVKKIKITNGVIEEKKPGKPYHEFDDHEKEGERMVREMDPDLFNEYGLDQDRIARLVGAHYAPMKGIKEMRKTTNWDDFVSAYRALEETINETNVPKEEVMTMFLADCLAKGKSCTDVEELKAVREAILTSGRNLARVYRIQKGMYGSKE